MSMHIDKGDGLSNSAKVQQAAHEASLRWGNTAASQRPPLRDIPLGHTVLNGDARGIMLKSTQHPASPRNVQHFLCLYVENMPNYQPGVVRVVFDELNRKHAERCDELSSDTIADSYADRDINNLLKCLGSITPNTPIST